MLKSHNITSTFIQKTHCINCFLNLKVVSLLNKNGTLVTKLTAIAIQQDTFVNPNTCWKQDPVNTWDLLKTRTSKTMKYVSWRISQLSLGARDNSRSGKRLIPKKIKETIHSLRNPNRINKMSYTLAEIWLPNLIKLIKQRNCEVKAVFIKVRKILLPFRSIFFP